MDFTKEILNWYSLNKRELPWRGIKNPYFIWLSEIILQQTRIDQGWAYYEKFISNYPTVEDLANATEDSVLKDWQGLGYYSRARNLHATAKYITSELQGDFPKNYNEILKLKGVGPYTAAAIASFAFNQKKAVVDGNVFRVLSRFYGIDTPIDSTEGKKEFENLANELISEKDPDLYNHAIMDFGATQCVPKSPNCEICPLSNNCYSFNTNKVTSYPVKKKKVKITDRFFNYLVLEQEGNYIFKKRNENGIWRNLYEFPLFETSNKDESPHFETMGYPINNNELELVFETKHILSHQRIYAKFWALKKGGTSIPYDNLEFRSPEEIAMPRLIEKYLDQL